MKPKKKLMINQKKFKNKKKNYLPKKLMNLLKKIKSKTFKEFFNIQLNKNQSLIKST